MGGDGPVDVLLRARGPSLATADPNLANQVASDPMLEIPAAKGTLLETNDDWAGHSRAADVLVPLQPEVSEESALVRLLLPAAYTAVVRSAAPGLGIVEAFVLGAEGE